jgi:hypothetical protein
MEGNLFIRLELRILLPKSACPFAEAASRRQVKAFHPPVCSVLQTLWPIQNFDTVAKMGGVRELEITV